MLVKEIEGEVVDADVDFDGRVCRLVRRDNCVDLVVAEEVWASSALYDPLRIRAVRWAFSDSIVVSIAPSRDEPKSSVQLLTKNSNNKLDIQGANHLIGGTNMLYACFGEDVFVISNALGIGIEAELAVALNGSGDVIFGLQSVLRDWPGSEHPIEVAAACIADGDKLVIFFSNCPGIWIMNARERTLVCLPGSETLGDVWALSSRGDHIAILSDGIDGLYVKFIDFRGMQFRREYKLPYSAIIKNDAAEWDRRHSNYRLFDFVHGCPNGRFVMLRSGRAVILDVGNMAPNP